MTAPHGPCRIAPITAAGADWNQARTVTMAPVSRKPLSRRQERVLAFIEGYMGTYGYAPSWREIADGAGLCSLSSVRHQLLALASRGLLVLPRDARRPRSLRLVRPGEVA